MSELPDYVKIYDAVRPGNGCMSREEMNWWDEIATDSDRFRFHLIQLVRRFNLCVADLVLAFGVTKAVAKSWLDQGEMPKDQFRVAKFFNVPRSWLFGGKDFQSGEQAELKWEHAVKTPKRFDPAKIVVTIPAEEYQSLLADASSWRGFKVGLEIAQSSKSQKEESK